MYERIENYIERLLNNSAPEALVEYRKYKRRKKTALELY